MAFLGIILVLNPGEGVFQVASLWALIAGMFGAVSSVALRFAHYTEPFERTLFYYFLVGVVASGVVVLVNPQQNWNSLDWSGIFWLGMIGLTGVSFQILYTLACKHGPVRMISVFLYASVIFGIMVDWLIWGREISVYTFLGFILVVIGAFLMVYLFPKEEDKISS